MQNSIVATDEGSHVRNTTELSAGSLNKGHGFPVPERRMRAAMENGVSSGAAGKREVLRTPLVVYTPSGVAIPPSGQAAETDTQEPSNAAV